MAIRPEQVMKVEAELRAPVATAQLVHFRFDEPIDNLSQKTDSFRLDLCLTPRPRNARVCFPSHWHSGRFERVGTLFMVPAGESMRVRSDGCCEQDSLICEFNPEVMGAWFDGELQWTDRRLLGNLDIRDSNIQVGS